MKCTKAATTWIVALTVVLGAAAVEDQECESAWLD